MAERPAWTLDGYVKKDIFSFEWNGGFAVSQKKKNISNLHMAIYKKYYKRALEISTKSGDEIGRRLSAFNLKIGDYCLENIFQSSKIYEQGGPYLDLLTVHPKESKQDERHRTSGNLKVFLYKGERWELEPKTAFYDYIYLLAAKASLEEETLNSITRYDWFTDIEFNPNKSVNCQAEGAALLKYVVEHNCWEVLESKETWLEFYLRMIKEA